MEASPVLDGRHARALVRADRMDAKWFRARPFALFRLRDSLAFEGVGWGEEDRARLPFVLVEMLDRKTFELERKFFFAKRRPDTDPATLGAIRAMIAGLEVRVAEGESGVANDDDYQRLEENRVRLRTLYPGVQRINNRMSL